MKKGIDSKIVVQFWWTFKKWNFFRKNNHNKMAKKKIFLCYKIFIETTYRLAGVERGWAKRSRVENQGLAVRIGKNYVKIKKISESFITKFGIWRINRIWIRFNRLWILVCFSLSNKGNLDNEMKRHSSLSQKHSIWKKVNVYNFY